MDARVCLYLFMLIWDPCLFCVSGSRRLISFAAVAEAEKQGSKSNGLQPNVFQFVNVVKKSNAQICHLCNLPVIICLHK